MSILLSFKAIIYSPYNLKAMIYITIPLSYVSYIGRVCYIYIYIYTWWLLLLLLNEVGTARLTASDRNPISPKNPAPQYQPIDRKKRMGIIVEDYSGDRAGPIKEHLPCSWNPPVKHHRIRGQQDRSRGTLRGEQKSCCTARFCSETVHKYTDVGDVRPEHRV